MRRYALTALLVALLALAGCRSGPGLQPLALGAAPWRDDDQAEYQVYGRDGAKLGTSDYRFHLDGNSWLLSETDDLLDGAQASTVRVDAQSLRPIDSGKSIHAVGSSVTVNAVYSSGKLEIRPVVNGKSDALTIPLPAGALDNDQVLMTLRALQFAAGYEGSMVAVVPARGLKLAVTLRVLGRETVDVPAGRFEAWRVELDSAGARQYAWYQVDPPHNLLQYDNGTSKSLLAGAALFLGSPPWQDGERATYDVLDRSGGRIGTSELAVGLDGGAWSLSLSEDIPDLRQSATVRIDGEHLRPLDGRKTVQSPGIEASYSKVYRDGQLEVKEVVNGRGSDLNLEVPADCLDGDQLLLTLRALEFAEGLRGKFVVAIPERALRLTVPVRIVGREQVTVPAGTFTTWRVEMEVGSETRVAWYQVTAPRNLVQYDDGTNRAVLVRVMAPGP